MQRRALLKLAAGTVAAATVAHILPEEVAAAPYMVGTGCYQCRPDLYLAGTDKDRLPLGPNHHAAQWVDWKRSTLPATITLGGVPVKDVTELVTGVNGWIIRYTRHAKSANGTPMVNLCPCSMLDVQIELWRGHVEADGVYSLSTEQIIEGREAARLRELRFNLIEQLAESYPDFADQIWAEQREHPGMLPSFRREVLIDWPETYRMNNGYLYKKPGKISLYWYLMEAR